MRYLSLAVVAVLAHPLLAQSPEPWLAKARTVLASHAGTITVAGLKEPVEIVRDRWGVPHIYAKNADDLFFAQGFVVAQDRLFQLDLWRRHGAGEMAEILGESAVASDTFARLIKYRGDMDAEWQSYSPDTRAIATAFTRGINACIDHVGDKLPIEFQILGYRPKKWEPMDILNRGSGIYMSRNLTTEVQRVELLQQLGRAQVKELNPFFGKASLAPDCPLSDDDIRHFPPEVIAGYKAFTKLLSYQPPRSESNNWVMSGAKTASGMPMLASDPHRAIVLPSLRYLVHLHAPGWNVIGAGEPGLPGVALGHNEQIAWGITIVGTDQTDLFIETTDPAEPTRYKVDGQWTAMKTVQEQIAVKSGKPKEVTLAFTRNGPVLHHDVKRGRAYALRWAGSEPGGAAYLGGLAVARAQNKAEFLTALKSWKIPALNFVYADKQKQIGWIAAGLTPVRPKGNGLTPVPADAGFEWSDFLKVEQYPQDFDPARTLHVTANDDVVDRIAHATGPYRHLIGLEFAPPYRARTLLSALLNPLVEKWRLEQFCQQQHNVHTLQGARMVRLLNQALRFQRGNAFTDPKVKAAAEQMTRWNGNLDTDAPLGTLHALWMKYLERDFYLVRFPSKQAELAASLGGGFHLPWRLLFDNDSNGWFKTSASQSEKAVFERTGDWVLGAFAKAVADWHKLPPEQQRRWGALHTATFRHPLSAWGPQWAEALNVGPFERGGDATTPNNTKYDDKFQQVHGASYRHVFDLADWDLGLATSAPGQSGQPGSPHYGDLAPLWAKGEYFPLAYTRAKVDEVARNRLVLSPH